MRYCAFVLFIASLLACQNDKLAMIILCSALLETQHIVELCPLTLNRERREEATIQHWRCERTAMTSWLMFIPWGVIWHLLVLAVPCWLSKVLFIIQLVSPCLSELPLRNFVGIKRRDDITMQDTVWQQSTKMYLSMCLFNHGMINKLHEKSF